MHSKPYLLIIGLVCQLTAFSQNLYGIFAGPQVNTARYIIAGEKQDVTQKIGFQLGANMKVPFENSLYFAPQIYYSMKGYQVSYTQYRFMPDTLATNNDVTVHTIEIAPLLQFDLGKGPTHAFFRFGPALDLQLFGHEEYDLRDGGKVSRDMPWAFDKYGHYSTNILIHLGVELNGGFFFFGRYSHGIGSINNYDGGPYIRHRSYGISIGKFFRNKKIVMDTKNKE